MKGEEEMKGKELIAWIVENKLEEAEVYVNGAKRYEKVLEAWESEYAGGAVMLETDRER